MRLDPLDILVTENLELRPIQQSESAFLYMLRSDPEVNRYIDRKAPESMATIEDFIARRIEEREEGALARYWVIFLKTERFPLGTICLWNADVLGASIEMGYELMPSHQGQGHMTEAVVAVTRATLHSATEVNKISAFTKPENIASNRLLDRAGFRVIGTEGQFRIWSLCAMI